MKNACETEIVELHRFFQEWFRGELPNTSEAYMRFAAVMEPHFQMVTPSGMRISQPALLESLRAAHASQPDCAIWIENCEGRELSGDLCQMTYKEWQGHGDAQRGRLSSALFRRNAEAPQGVEWIHLHEVWLPQP